MASQETLVSRLAAIERLLAQPVSVSKAPTETDHNESARILRNGLTVTLFASLEDFARSRSSELLQLIAAAIPFTNLPEKLQEAATVGAAEAVGFRLRFEERGAVRRQFVQSHAQVIASTLATPYWVSNLAFLHSSPNVGEDDFASLIKCFGVESPWTQIDQLSTRLGISLIDSKQAFSNLLSRRNAAAHEADSAVEHADVLAFIDTVAAVAVSADLLLTSAAKQICAGKAPGMKGNPKRVAGDIALRILERHGAKPNAWREIRESAKRASHLHADLATGIAQASARAAKENSHLIVLPRPKRVLSWFSP